MERIINESVKKSRGFSGDITKDMWHRLIDINTEITNFLDASKLPNSHRKLYNSFKVKNGNQALVKGDYLSMLLDVGLKSNDFYSIRYLGYGEIDLITR